MRPGLDLVRAAQADLVSEADGVLAQDPPHLGEGLVGLIAEPVAQRPVLVSRHALGRHPKLGLVRERALGELPDPLPDLSPG